MKKKLLVCVIAYAMLLGSCALAEETAKVQERIDHLLSHGKRAEFVCAGDLVKLRIAPGANKMHGRMVPGEAFRILDTFGEWVHVEIVDTMPNNEGARRGMTGWIHAEHIACACDLETEQDAESDPAAE